MYDQPRYETYQPSEFFDDGTSARPQEPGTVAYGTLGETEYLKTGRIDGKAVDEFPFPITKANVLRGQQRFNIYCAPCHGQTGAGDGMIVQRGFPKPPPLYGPVMRQKLTDPGPVVTYNDLREAPVGHFVEVIANGHGVMYSYAARVKPEDRWNIAAYIRALQASQYATPDVLKGLPEPTAEEKQLLQEASR
jgi:mono/diheme cytochrome c family protein